MRQICEAFALVAELGCALGVRDISKRIGTWNIAVDEHWTVRLNPHTETIDSIPPYHMWIGWNEWPAGIVGPGGGIIAAGELANEATFIAAVRAAIAKAAEATHKQS